MSLNKYTQLMKYAVVYGDYKDMKALIRWKINMLKANGVKV